MKLKYLFFFLFLFTFSNGCYVNAGGSYLLQAEQVEKTKLLNKLSGEYLEKQDFGKSSQYAQEALKVASEINFKKGQTDALFNLIELANSDLRYDDAAKYLEKLLSLGDNSTTSATRMLAWLKKGQLQHNQGNYDEALSNHIKALKLAISRKDQDRIGEIYLAIAKTYQQKNNTAVANDFLRLYHQNSGKNQPRMAYVMRQNISNNEHYIRKSDLNKSVALRKKKDPLLIIFGIVFFMLSCAFIMVFFKLMRSIRQSNKHQRLMKA